jgi:hypothetical protein
MRGNQPDELGLLRGFFGYFVSHPYPRFALYLTISKKMTAARQVAPATREASGRCPVKCSDRATSNPKPQMPRMSILVVTLLFL